MPSEYRAEAKDGGFYARLIDHAGIDVLKALGNSYDPDTMDSVAVIDSFEAINALTRMLAFFDSKKETRASCVLVGIDGNDLRLQHSSNNEIVDYIPLRDHRGDAFDDIPMSPKQLMHVFRNMGQGVITWHSNGYDSTQTFTITEKDAELCRVDTHYLQPMPR